VVIADKLSVWLTSKAESLLSRLESRRANTELTRSDEIYSLYRYRIRRTSWRVRWSFGWNFLYAQTRQIGNNWNV